MRHRSKHHPHNHDEPQPKVLAVQAVFKTGKGGRTRHILVWLQGQPLDAERKPGGVPETLGILASRMP